MLELLRLGLIDVIAHPEKMLDAEYDMFAPLVATVPAYAEYLRELEGATALAVDGKTRVSSIGAVRKEIYIPVDADNARSTPETLEHITAFATGMLRTLMNGQAARYVDGGEYSKENQTEEMLAAFIDTDRTTNACESYFGALKWYDDIYHCESYNSNAVIACKKDHIFSDNAHKYINHSTRRKEEASSSTAKRRRRIQTTETARIDECGAEGVSVIMHLSRTSGKKKYKADALADKADADKAACAKEKDKVKAALESQIKRYVKAQDAMAVAPLVDNATLVRTSLSSIAAQVNTVLARATTPAARFRLLKTNVERYTNGMGLADLAPKSFTSSVDATIGEAGSVENITFLRGALLEAYKRIKEEKLALTDEAAVPETHRRKLPALGCPSLQRVELETAQPSSAGELRAAADEYRARARAPRVRSAAGVAGERACAALPPPIDAALIGRRVDVAWELTYKRRDGGEYTGTFWCPGEIARVSTARSRDGRRHLGIGHIYVKYDDGAQAWLLASRPNFFNASKPGAWRFERDDDGDDEDDEEGDDDLVDAEEEKSDDDDDDDMRDS